MFFGLVGINEMQERDSERIRRGGMKLEGRRQRALGVSNQERTTNELLEHYSVRFKEK